MTDQLPEPDDDDDDATEKNRKRAEEIDEILDSENDEEEGT